MFIIKINKDERNKNEVMENVIIFLFRNGVKFTSYSNCIEVEDGFGVLSSLSKLNVHHPVTIIEEATE